MPVRSRGALGIRKCPGALRRAWERRPRRLSRRQGPGRGLGQSRRWRSHRPQGSAGPVNGRWGLSCLLGRAEKSQEPQQLRPGSVAGPTPLWGHRGEGQRPQATALKGAGR